MSRQTLRTKLLAKRDDLYSTLVFQNLDEEETSWGRYLMVTLLPNGQTRVPNIGEEGFLTLDSVKAGDTYYKPDLVTSGVYKQDGQYFMSFTKIPDVVERLEYKF